MASREEESEMASHFCDLCGQSIPKRKQREHEEDEFDKDKFSRCRVLYPTESDENLEYCECMVDLAMDHYNSEGFRFYRVVDLITVTLVLSKGAHLYLKFTAKPNARSGNVTFEARIVDGVVVNAEDGRETRVESVEIVADEAATPQFATSRFATKRAPTLSGGIWDVLL